MARGESPKTGMEDDLAPPEDRSGAESFPPPLDTERTGIRQLDTEECFLHPSVDSIAA